VVHASDLLPMAFTEASLAMLVANVQRVQDRLRRPLLVENLSAYLHWADDRWPSPSSSTPWRSAAAAAAAGREQPGGQCAERRGGDETVAVPACRWVDRVLPRCGRRDPPRRLRRQRRLVIDDHGSRVHAPVWQVYAHAVRRLGARPTLIEWDTALPAGRCCSTRQHEADAVIAAHTLAVAAVNAALQREALRQQMLLRALLGDARRVWSKAGCATARRASGGVCRPTGPMPARWPNGPWRRPSRRWSPCWAKRPSRPWRVRSGRLTPPRQGDVATWGDTLPGLHRVRRATGR
jgi:hypothetical protein